MEEKNLVSGHMCNGDAQHRNFSTFPRPPSSGLGDGIGAEQLFGDAGNDAIKGGDGIDTFFGDAGDDRFYSEDANANEPGDAGEGMDRAFFSDCILPFDDFPNIESLRTLGNRHWFGCGCC
jgi:hemolysin type calcium-binding protein